MCIIAVPVALVPVMFWGRHVPRRLTYTLAWIGSALLVVRSGASLAKAGYLIATGRFRLANMGIWEAWLYLGATLSSLSTWRSRSVGNAIAYD